jgi:DNA modification methylase
VLKPGGHALIACGTRTQHRMAVNIEDAGFEIRDVVIWAYGSGFPKSLNVAKKIDELQGNEREVIGRYESPEGTSGNKGSSTCFQGTPRDGLAILTKGTSAWEGWGTALKPAVELWTLARKPLSEKTVAENVLKWGTGGINIDECRVEFISEEEHEKTKRIERGNYDYGSGHIQQLKARPVGAETISNPKGRFPANLLHDGSDEVVSLFPNTKSGGGNKNSKNSNAFFGNMKPNEKYDNNFNADSGSASRFFYCAKASKSERNKGCEGLEEKEGIRTNAPRENEDVKTPKRTNNHPTVKPVALLQYLIRLITPPQGTVLDCFAGSGSTGVACIKENKNYILIEREHEYIQIINARVNQEHKQSNQYPTLFDE